MKKGIARNVIVFGIITLFIEASIVFGINIQIEETTSSRGNTLYVGGSGEGNYTRIQDAINNASDGDTVFVYNGTYDEYLIINIRINLIGESTHNTIVTKYASLAVITISSDHVKVQGFTISHKSPHSRTEYGIEISSSHCNISYCKLIHNSYDDIRIFGFSNHNNIYRNIFQSVSYGIRFENCFSGSNTIKHNNFISDPAEGISFRNHWVSNYYENWTGIGPKIISGHFFWSDLFWINIDWRPSKVPYDI